MPFGDNAKEVKTELVKQLEFDCILFQRPSNHLYAQHPLFSEAQLKLPKIYLEHDPPQEIRTDTRHVVTGGDPRACDPLQQAQWDNGDNPTLVIDHGIELPHVDYTGAIEKGIVVINNLDERGRRLGLDIFLEVRKHVPLDLIGMGAENLGGTGEILHPQLPGYASNYRFFFNPIRYTSLGSPC